jgi:hypothetical protein
VPLRVGGIKTIGGWAELVRQKTKPSLSLKNNLGVSDLLLAIREVDEVIHVLEELWFAGLCKWWGTMLYDSLSKPIVAE